MPTIVELHREVFEYLMEKRQQMPDLCFTLRTNNAQNRLGKGYWFWGTDDSLYFSFWHGTDRTNNTPNISITIKENGDMFIWLNAKDSEGKSAFFEILAKGLGKFTRTRNFQTKGFENTWRRNYVQEGWKNGLQEFLENDFSRINAAIREYPFQEELADLKLIGHEEFAKNQETFEKLRAMIASFSNGRITTDQPTQEVENSTQEINEYVPIKLEEIYLRNIGHFEEVTIPLDKRITVLIGENGSGKSTILRALALGLVGTKEFFLEDAILSDKFFMSWLRILNYDEKGKALYASSGVISLGYRKNEKMHCNNVSLHFKSSIGVISQDNLEENTDYFASLFNEKQNDMLFLGFPQGGGHKKPMQLSDDNSPQVIDLLPIIIDEAHQKLERLKNWIDVNYSKHLQALKDGSENEANKLLSKINDVFRLISLIVSDNRREHEIRFKMVSYEEDGKNKEVVVLVEIAQQDNYQTISLDLASQGFQNLFYWIGELVSRCYQVNEYYQEKQPKKYKENIFEMDGIVLIDEIDTYLHPNWQRNILKVLVEKFKNLQFVVTTHSLAVIPSVKDDNYVIYRAVDINSRRIFTAVKPQYGFSFSQTATDIMKNLDRDREVVELEKLIEDLIAHNQFEKAKEELVKLNSESSDTRRLKSKLETQILIYNAKNRKS
jgi:predicted ATP-binding protein involved in virulence